MVLAKDIEVETATAGASFNSVEGKKIEDSALDITENDNFKILQHGNMIEILGAEDENSPVTVYDDMGRVVEHTNSHSITLNKKGVYILSVEGRRFKFVIKN